MKWRNDMEGKQLNRLRLRSLQEIPLIQSPEIAGQFVLVRITDNSLVLIPWTSARDPTLLQSIVFHRLTCQTHHSSLSSPFVLLLSALSSLSLRLRPLAYGLTHLVVTSL